MSTDLQPVLQYLTALEAHNTREWYHAHSAERREAEAGFEALLHRLILCIREFDPSVPDLEDPKELTFRLVRDTRFSHDKSPYNPAFRAHLSSGGKLPIPVGYYLMIRPGNRSFLGGGLFTDVFREATAMVRGYISANSAEWESILNAPEFRERFTVKGNALKNVPAGFDKTDPQAEFIKMKSWYLEYPVSDAELLDPEVFIAHAADLFRCMKPLNDFLNRALVGFRMPER